MFRSFFPAPRQFFASAALWFAVTIVIWLTVGVTVRSVVSVDRFFTPAICAPGADPAADQPTTQSPATQADPASSGPAAGAPQTNPNAPATTESAAPGAAVTAPTCVTENTDFLNGERLWQYQYIIMSAFLFCAFWYFYRRNEWYWWSVVGSTGILLIIYFNVQVDAFVNDWQGSFFNTLQSALTTPGSVSAETFYGEIATLILVLTPRILVLVILAFFTSHYVFRWRKAMNSYYMAYWSQIRTTEGASQRVQEDTMRFASIMEDLGTSFLDSFITLAVFLPILWTLSQSITQLPFFGDVPGGLVWVALISAAFGTVLLAVVGIRLPGLNFDNQRVEAAYRKELVYGEDSGERADPVTVKQLFANVQTNYFRIYWHYTYFNVARYAYLQMAGYIPLLMLSPSILAGAITLGLYQQVQQAFGQVAGSFQFLARAWTTIIELISVYKRLRRFESFIPLEQGAIKESVGQIATE